ncbi:MAG: hypothetical protein C0418_03030 [Coriobacteriaceae bacterium]|nr:hypothetical protein [Coriobacteriaceae bacterium]
MTDMPRSRQLRRWSGATGAEAFVVTDRGERVAGRKVLMLTYEFPPSGGAGVQRMAKFARYLPEHGWEPVVVCAEPAQGRPLDSSLMAEVATVPVTRLPGRHVAGAIAGALRPLKRALGRGGSAGAGPTAAPAARTQPLSGRISSWVAVPDDAVLWARDAAEAAVREGRRAGVRAVIATGPPHSVLVAGMRAAAELGVPFVADMRDAWRDNPGIRFATGLHRSRSLKLERAVLKAAAAVTAVSGPIADEARALGAREVHVLPNGYDPADLPPHAPAPQGPPTVTYMGRFYGSHDPRHFLAGFAEAIRAGGAAAGLRFEFVGPEPELLTAQAEALGIGAHVVAHGYLPHHEALAVLARADAGLVVITDEPGSASVLTGKVFEYLGMGLPVLLVGPTRGAAADLIAELHAGLVAADGDVPAIAAALVRIAEAKSAGTPLAEPDAVGVARFDRRAQAAELAGLLDAVTGGAHG